MLDRVDIADDDVLLRRLVDYYVKADDTIDRRAYMVSNKPDPKISVNLARLTTIEDTIASRPTFGVGALEAGVPRRMGFVVYHDPVPDNHAHSVIEGVKTKEDCSKLASATWIVRRPVRE